MTKPDPKLVEQIVEIITHEVLAAMAEQDERAAHPEAFQCKFECADQLCVKMCMDKTGNVISAGAERLTSTLGVIPGDASIAGIIRCSSLMLRNRRLPNSALKRGNTSLLRYV